MFENERTNKIKTPGMTDSSSDRRNNATENEQRGEHGEISRRSLLKGGGALAGLTVLQVAGPAHAFPGHSVEGDGDDDQSDTPQGLGHSDEEVIPWLDQPPESPIPDNVGNLLKWEELDSWRIPSENFFFVNHYGQPDGLNEATWRVGIAGLVAGCATAPTPWPTPSGKG